jgi:hypothetical protein
MTTCDVLPHPPHPIHLLVSQHLHDISDVRHFCATQLQSCVRRHLAERRFCITLYLVVQLQSALRRNVVRRLYLGITQQLNEQSGQASAVTRFHAATLLQAMSRTLLGRARFLEAKRGASIVQRAFRTHSVRVAVRRMIAHAANGIASCYRSYSHRKLCRAATVVASAYRSFAKRWDFLLLQSSCTLISSHYRGYVARKPFVAALGNLRRFAAVIIWRAWKRYDRTRKMVMIQSSVRRFVSRAIIRRRALTWLRVVNKSAAIK